MAIKLWRRENNVIVDMMMMSVQINVVTLGRSVKWTELKMSLLKDAIAGSVLNAGMLA